MILGELQWGAVDGCGQDPQQANLLARLAASGVRFAFSTGDEAYSDTHYGNHGIRACILEAARIVAPAVPRARKPRAQQHLPEYVAGGRGRCPSGGRQEMDTYCGLNGTASQSYPSVWYALDVGNARSYLLDTEPRGCVGRAESRWRCPNRAKSGRRRT